MEKAFWCQLLSWFPALLLSVAIGNSAWLCGNITISQGSETNAPLRGSRVFLSLQVHVVLCPCFRLRRACKQLKDCENKAVVLKYEKDKPDKK